ncbi:MAG: PSD1 and planctomycete cytochrome C domain-containing protein [Bryobacteraceae bacterium]
MRHSLRAVLYTATAAAVCAQGNDAGSLEFFENKIRPILANNCYGCHTNSALGGLRVDDAESLAKGGKRGPAVVPGDPAKSLLIAAVKQLDPSLKMPMGDKLKDSEIAALTAWVQAGAVWPKAAAPAKQSGGKFRILPEMRNFWSLKPLDNPAPPIVKDRAWPKTAIDRFVLSKLESESLKPVRPASRHDLIRRATLDLTGLPPTFEEIQAFEADNSPEAFAKVVDRLLKSPHYGERWGRYWLDVARYGEDDYRSLNPNPRGYRPYPNAFAYRDWVIRALNDDMPYDEFVKAQLAADQMEEKVRYKNIAATGFLGLGPWYYDNGAFEITRADERHDRVDVITRGFLGMTVACARCHDHKYDPVPQTDYYSLAGVFYNTIYEEYPLAPKKVVDEYTRLEDDYDRAQLVLKEASEALSTNLSRALAYKVSDYLLAVWEVTGPQRKKVEDIVEARRLDYEQLDRWIKYMARKTTRYKYKEPWQAMIEGGKSTMPEARKLAAKMQERIVALMLQRNELDAENKVITAKDLDGTKPKRRTDKPSNFVSFKDFNPGSWLQLKGLPEEDNNFWTEIFQREIGENDDPNAMMAMGRRVFKPGVLLYRGWGLESRVGHEAQERLKTLQTAVAEIKKKIDARYPFVHGVRDAETPVDIQVSHRGDPANPVGPEIRRHFLSVLCDGEPKPFSKGSGRLELAGQIVSQPLAMRVFVNRIWKGHFGTGIVDTPSNFGSTGERPANPELLEYLAAAFRKQGMSMKKLHREIMLSAVYQLSTENDEAAAAKDSANRLYWRANRKRMDAEQIRDSIMYVAGKLDPAVGGPSEELTPSMLRRTVYGKVSRYKPDEYLMLFDFPSPLISAEKRFVTTVPQQRLFLMNSDFMQIQAEELAKRVAAEATQRDRIRKAYELVYGRNANEQEIAMAVEYLKAEPVTEYEERRKKVADKDTAKPDAENSGKAATPDLSKPDPAAAPEVPVTEATGAKAEGTEPGAGNPVGEGAAGEGAMGQGMMAGTGGRRGGPPTPPPVKYDVTVWGRYAKVLLSSTEFLFIN